MTINHIDQLAQWWETAEEGDARPGDTIITPGSTHYLIETAPDYPLDRANQPYRILARAPKPKPAWHDAVAVIATVPKEYGEDERGVWVPGASGMWEDGMGRMFDPGDLRDVTPLIEAKVTDAQARKALNLYYEASPGENDWPENSVTLMRLAIAAALGLETA